MMVFTPLSASKAMLFSPVIMMMGEKRKSSRNRTQIDKVLWLY